MSHQCRWKGAVQAVRVTYSSLLVKCGRGVLQIQGSVEGQITMTLQGQGGGTACNMSCPSRKGDFVLGNVAEKSSISHDSAAPVVLENQEGTGERGG